MPTVWLNFQPAVELQHSFPCWMLPHPLPTLGTFLAVLTHAKPFLEWDVAPLGPLTGSSAFLKFQLLTSPLFARFSWSLQIPYGMKASLREPLGAKNTWNEKIPSVESLCGKAVYCHFQATWSQCTEPELKHRLVVLLTHQNAAVCTTPVNSGMLLSVTDIRSRVTLRSGLVPGCLFHVFSEVFLWE